MDFQPFGHGGQGGAGLQSIHDFCILFVKIGLFSGLSGWPAQLDARQFPRGQRLARALRDKVTLDLCRQGKSEGYYLGIQGVGQFEIVFDGADLNAF